MSRAAVRLQNLSRASAMRFGSRLGAFGYRVAGRARRRTLANLRLAFGNSLSDEQRSDLAQRVFAHFGRAAVDFLRAPALKVNDLEKLVQCEGWEYAEAALQDGHGLLLVTGHLGNWEILGRWLALVKKVPLTVVARDPRGAAFAAYIKQTREASGFRVLSAGTSARELLRVLRRGEAICLLADQNSGDVFTPFFGIPAGTVAGPASLALHTRAPLVPIFCTQQPDGTFVVRCSPAIPLHDLATELDQTRANSSVSTHNAHVEGITTRLNAALEAAVRRDPDQWLWVHNRWKSAFDDGQRTRAWGTDPDAEARCTAARARWH